MKNLIHLILIAAGFVYSNDAQSKLNYLLKAGDLERIPPLFYASVIQIHPAIRYKMDSAVVLEIEGNLKTEIRENIFEDALLIEFKSKYNEIYFQKISKIFSDSLMISFLQAEKYWNSQEGQKACAERNLNPAKTQVEEKKRFVEKWIKKADFIEKMLALYDMALNAQMNLILKSQGNNQKLTEKMMRESIKTGKMEMLKQANQGLKDDYYCLFESFEINQLNKLYNYETSKEFKWFENILWGGLEKGYKEIKL